MPFDASTQLRRDLATNGGRLHAPESGVNQAAPLLISSHGRVVHSAAPFTFAFAEGELIVEGAAQIDSADSPDLRSAVKLAAEVAFTPSGTTPAERLFTGPIYNVWMELPFTPTQDAVLDYARRVVEAGLPPGVLMIDDNWARSYGDWTFDSARFPSPRDMVAELESMGFPVMLWIAPYVTPDSGVFRELRRRGMLLLDKDGNVAVRQWWNGYGALLDLTNPETVEWVMQRLNALRSEQGIAGFKFDGGDLADYRAGDGGAQDAPTAQCQAWSRIGVEFEFNEFRASWGTSGWPLVQRLADKSAIPFIPGGLDSLIPEGIAQGLSGYPYSCPDLIGGGEIGSAAGGLNNEEFVVRYAQCSMLFPLVQFSANPARILGPAALAAVREALRVRASLLPEIRALASHAARSGEPILRPLAYHYPGTERVKDQFLVGESILVAPVLEAGATQRQVVLPEGTWRDDLGNEYQGPLTINRSVDLASLPHYRRVDAGVQTS